MRAPAFWYAREGREAAPLTRAMLTPLSWLYRAGADLRRRRATPFDPGVPVICVGNVTLGGAGKTPVARAILSRLRAGGVEAHALSRGHGGRETGPLRVDPAAHEWSEVGDEPLLLARTAPAWIARAREDGARAAAAAGAQAIVMDDGFQNPGLTKTLSLLVIDAEAAYGNGRVFPAGPMRETLAAALSRADAVVLMTPGPAFAADPARLGLSGFDGPVLRAWLAPAAPPPDGPLVAFAGIGRPQKFFDTLRATGGEIVEETGFPDHHPFSEGDLDWLAASARERGATLITTEKDHVRLPAEMRDSVGVLPVEARFADDTALGTLLERVMDAGAGGG